jgi:uncharacterized protein YbjT (DUF2867 family)
MPGFGPDEGRFRFFAKPDQSVHFLAVEDIGKFAATIFAEPVRFRGKTFEIATDAATGRELEAIFTEAAGRPVPYARFPDEVLTANPFLEKLTALMKDALLGGATGHQSRDEIVPVLACWERTSSVRTSAQHVWRLGIR